MLSEPCLSSTRHTSFNAAAMAALGLKLRRAAVFVGDERLAHVPRRQPVEVVPGLDAEARLHVRHLRQAVDMYV
jgi:hypothetical protein